MLLREIQNYYNSLKLLPNATIAYRRNKLKEFLHIYVLSFIYKTDLFRELIFYGGTCLRHCFALPRLSEDLDFEYLNGEFPFEQLERDLQEYFMLKLGLVDFTTKIQKFRLYLKFPILSQLGVANQDESDFLHIKIEVNQTKHENQTFNTEVHPFFGAQQTFFIKRYDLETLMASKMLALVDRSWVRHHKHTEEVSVLKGRDYYDLLWYMQRKVRPNIGFTRYSNQEAFWLEVLKKVKLADERSLKNDLIDFVEDPKEAEDFARNFKASFDSLAKANYSGLVSLD